jgi:alkanesulfonate monooxygenase SsuD/methylene tetrahydromethanopterin reductase-like flavin-dependent oxidoreductase (luciferase family)
VALAGEIADGWLAIYFSPRLAEQYQGWLAEGFARRSREPRDFEIAASAQVLITDDPAAELERLRPVMALYLGGMGAEQKNFHADLFRRMGYGPVVDEITRLFRTGRKAEAAGAVPDELVNEIAIIGSAAEVRERVEEWEKAGVTMMLVSCRDVAQVRALAGLVQPLPQTETRSSLAR